MFEPQMAEPFHKLKPDEIVVKRPNPGEWEQGASKQIYSGHKLFVLPTFAGTIFPPWFSEAAIYWDAVYPVTEARSAAQKHFKRIHRSISDPFTEAFQTHSQKHFRPIHTKHQRQEVLWLAHKRVYNPILRHVDVWRMTLGVNSIIDTNVNQTSVNDAWRMTHGVNGS